LFCQRKPEIIRGKKLIMENNPTFSIILPTYNRAHLLQRAITSVLSQSYGNFELLIINDGSTDTTNAVVHSIHDPRIQYRIQERNYGVQRSRNLGLDIATGKYLYFLDDDDELTQGALELIIKLVESVPFKDFKIFWFDSIDAEINTLCGVGLGNVEKKVVYLDLLCGKIRGDYTQVINREAFGTNRFDERLWGYEGLLLLKLHKQYDGYYFPRVVKKAYRHHGVRMCTMSILPHIPHYILGETIYIKEFGDEFKTVCPEKYAEHLSNLGYYQMLNGQKGEARDNILLSLKYKFSMKFFIFYVVSYFLSKQQVIYLCSTFNKI
jgi:glycosyltransferase involved in cell wall biosynthesis